LIVCKVIGQTVSTIKDKRLERHRLLIVGKIGNDPDVIVDRLVALDTVGAGEGMMVGVVQGAPALAALGDPTIPIDAVIVAIFDSLETQDKKTYAM
jgi:ethanolamine utilization protein EutN